MRVRSDVKGGIHLGVGGLIPPDPGF